MDIQALKNKYDIVGNDPALTQALETAMKFAPTDLSVVILGESGVGKENFARIIHQYSPRKNGPYFVVNCGALAKELVNSELFGHVKGAFTGSTETRKGYFEDANGGTLFLDEIAELPLESQALLLRVLQSGEYRKVGSNKIEHTDVRIVAATNVNLYESVRRGKFREDLYFRLSAAQIRIPALRERKDDIYLLFRKFSSDFSEASGMCKISLRADAIRLLTTYRWPGNVRQLMHFTQALTAQVSRKVTPTVQRIELSASELAPLMPVEEGEPIPMVVDGGHAAQGGGTVNVDLQAVVKAIFDLNQRIDDLESRVEQRQLPPPPIHETAEWQGPEAAPEAVRNFEIVTEGQPREEPEGPSATIRELEKEQILHTLDKFHGNRKQTARELGISERTLYRKLEKYGVK